MPRSILALRSTEHAGGMIEARIEVLKELSAAA
jgi:hypothetical protein